MKLHQSVIFIVAIIAMLATLCVIFPQPMVKIGAVSLRFPSIEKMTDLSSSDTLRTAEQMLLAAEKAVVMQNVDSATQAQADSMAFYKLFFAQSPMRIACPKDNPEYLFPLFEALDNAKQKGVHIMHYGDSQIEGDRISGYLRTTLQKEFGGTGPGFIPVYQPISAMNVQQTTTDSVSMYYAGGMIGGRAQHNRYGAMAQVAQLNVTDTLGISIKSYKGHDISQLTIFAGNIDSVFSFTAGGKELKFAPTQKMTKQKIDYKNSVSSINAQMYGSAEVYGLYLSGNNGVNVSNIPLRGSDGTFFSRIESDAFKNMLSAVNTRLIIMEFGGNALPVLNDTTTADRWCKSFRKQVEHVRRLVPNALVLVIGPADMSVKTEGELHTHAMLPYLTQKMREEVTAGGGAFWDMYAVMGGEQSMIAWVNHSPAWAAPDYIHFTRKGANRISEVLCEALKTYYDYRKFLQQTKKTKCSKKH